MKQKCKLDSLILGSGPMLLYTCFAIYMSPRAYLLHQKGEWGSPIFIDKEIEGKVLGDFIKVDTAKNKWPLDLKPPSPSHIYKVQTL